MHPLQRANDFLFHGNPHAAFATSPLVTRQLIIRVGLGSKVLHLLLGVKVGEEQIGVAGVTG